MTIVALIYVNIVLKKFKEVEQPCKYHDCNLLLIPKNCAWYCNICNRNENNKFSIYCEKHDYDVCPKCFYKLAPFKIEEQRKLNIHIELI